MWRRQSRSTSRPSAVSAWPCMRSRSANLAIRRWGVDTWCGAEFPWDARSITGDTSAPVNVVAARTPHPARRSRAQVRGGQAACSTATPWPRCGSARVALGEVSSATLANSAKWVKARMTGRPDRCRSRRIMRPTRHVRFRNGAPETIPHGPLDQVVDRFAVLLADRVTEYRTKQPDVVPHRFSRLDCINACSVWCSGSRCGFRCGAVVLRCVAGRGRCRCR